MTRLIRHDRLGAKLSRLPDARETLAVHGLNPIGGTPAELAAIMRAELDRWGKVIRAANISPAD